MANYDYIDLLSNNANQLDGGYDDSDARLAVFKNKQLNDKLADIENQYNQVQTPRTDMASQLILSFAPAVAGLVGGESAALAAPKAQQQARDIYNSGLAEQKQAAADKRKMLLDQYNKLATVGAKQETSAQQADLAQQRMAQQQQQHDENLALRKLIASESAQDRKDRNQQAALEKKQKAEKPSDKQVDSVNDIDTAISDLQNIAQMKDAYKISTGQIAGRIPEMFSSPDVAAFRSALGRYKDQYRKAITGAGAGPTEIAMLEKRLPNEVDQPENFKAKTEEAIKELNRRKEVLLSNLEKQGKNVEPFRGEKQTEDTQQDGFTEEKAKRLAELRAKKAAGKLGQ